MKIKIVSPAKAIEPLIIDKAVELLSTHDILVETGEHAKGSFNYFSGTDDQRLSDLQSSLDDSTLDAILCSRGGYGMVRIIDQLDFKAFSKKPKFILGYSDITVLHSRLTNMGFESVHCTAPLNFSKNSTESIQSMLNVLRSAGNEYLISHHPLNREGTATAEVVGGNLAIIASLIGTNDELKTDGKILFIEDIGEAIYAVDRMLWTLEKSGKLERLKGLIVGGMTNMKDSDVPFGLSVEEVIRERVEKYDYPLAFNFPAGHIDDNRAIVLGRTASLEVSDSKTIFKQT